MEIIISFTLGAIAIGGFVFWRLKCSSHESNETNATIQGGGGPGSTDD